MAKRKGRAERRERRQRAAKARERGLPEGAPISEPARVRQPAGDVTELALKSGRGRSGGRRAPIDDRGFPMLGKVAIGAALALALVYGLSQLRKLDAPPVDENSGESEAPGEVGSRAQVPAAEAPDEGAAADDDEAALDDESLTSSMNERDAELAGDDAPLPAPSVPSAPSVGSVPTVAPASAPAKAPVPRPGDTVPSPAPQSPAPQGPAPQSPAPQSPAPQSPAPPTE